MKRILFLQILLFISVGIFLYSCQKESFDNMQERDTNYLYSKLVTVKNAGITLEALIEANNEELLNTTFLNVEPITELLDHSNQIEDDTINEELEKLENENADIKIKILKIQKNENSKGVKVIANVNDQQKIFWRYVMEVDPPRYISGCDVMNKTGKNCYAVFKWKKYGGCWKNIFRKCLNTRGDYVYGQVPHEADKLRLKIKYNTSNQPFVYNLYY